METAWHAISSFSKRCPSFGGIVAAEAAAALDRFRDRGRGLGRVRELGPQVLRDGGVDVEPGEVHRLERPDCGPACAKPVGDGAVDVGERANTRVDERICLPQERVLEAVGDEARNVPPDHDGGLAELFHPPSERLEGLGSGALPADDLHELDQLGRVEPVQAGEELRPREAAVERGQGEGRRVRREDCLGRGELLSLRQEFALRPDLLDDRLDDQLRTVEGFVDGAVVRRTRGAVSPSRERAVLRLDSRRAARRTEVLASAKTRAMPVPIVPAPTTATSLGSSTGARVTLAQPTTSFPAGERTYQSAPKALRPCPVVFPGCLSPA
jgi:hypothetical protein